MTCCDLQWPNCYGFFLQVVFVTFIAYAMLPLRTFVAALFSILLAAAHLTLTAIWADDWLTWQQVSFCSCVCFARYARPPACTSLSTLPGLIAKAKNGLRTRSLRESHNEAENIKPYPLFVACLGSGSLSLCVCKQATSLTRVSADSNRRYFESLCHSLLRCSR